MDSSVTQGTSKLSMIFSATVVLPEALPPQMPGIKDGFINIIREYILNVMCSPMTKGSTCWPAQLYHGGRPAV